jgi:UDP-glucose 4-epimerase
MQTVLITGGCGFIGTHLVASLLADGYGVTVLDDLSTGRREALDPRAALVAGDVASPADIAGAIAVAGPDRLAGIFHLAAIASVPRCLADPVRSRAVNADGTRNVLTAARRSNGEAIPVVFASSAAVYGDAGMAPARETRPPAPISPYGADKLHGEHHAALAAWRDGARATALRFFNVYGPGQDPSSPYSGVISIFADRLRAGRAVPLHGDGGQQRDFVYVADVVAHLRAAMARLATTPRAGFDVFNVCTGRAVTLAGLLAALARLIGRSPSVQPLPPRPGDIRVSVGDPAAATDALGLRAATQLADGLARLLAPGALAAK